MIGVKAVADYLNISVRNVYYWEKKFGLPLHRIAGVSGHRIHAYKDELERWLKSKEKGQLKRNAKRIWIPVAVIVPLVLVGLVILFSQTNNTEAVPATISAEPSKRFSTYVFVFLFALPFFPPIFQISIFVSSNRNGLHSVILFKYHDILNCKKVARQ